MTWEQLDWNALDRLRAGFLSGAAATGPYWKSAADLAAYDFTYGERIGWKWDQVLRELRLRGWRPASRDVFDWGCGSGIAARRVIAGFGADTFRSLTVWDQAAVACDFATEAAMRVFPQLAVASATPSLLASSEPLGLLVISHVLNELSPDQLAGLRTLIDRAQEVLWVEPGTSAVSRQLGRIRDELRERFLLVAPCTHQLACPMFSPGAERDWCHFFAPPPAEIYADSNWVKFGQRAGIDLRSLPYGYLALTRRIAGIREPHPSGKAGAGEPVPSTSQPAVAASALDAPAGQPADGADGWSRVIGRPEHFKPYARWLNCDATGLHQLELPKRADPSLYKMLERTKAPLVYRWQRDGNKVSGGEALG